MPGRMDEVFSSGYFNPSVILADFLWAAIRGEFAGAAGWGSLPINREGCFFQNAEGRGALSNREFMVE